MNNNHQFKKCQESNARVSRHIFLFCLFLTTCILSCKKFINIGPPTTEIVSETVFTDDRSATSAINGIYSEMMTNNGFADGGGNSITYLCGLSADEFNDFFSSGVTNQFHTNSLIATNSTVKNSIWELGYRYIWYANSILEGLASSTEVSQPIKKQLEGEAKFIRAFCNFYLTNLFGDIPLISSTDYRINRTASRRPQSEVYQSITGDLQDAIDLLSEDFSFSNTQRTRPNKYAAHALMARVYLYTRDWGNAEAHSTAVINKSQLFGLSALEDVFLANSIEAIWQLMPVQPGRNTLEGDFFISFGTSGQLSLTANLIGAFDPDDKRNATWINTAVVNSDTFYYPFKYKIGSSNQPLTEYSIVLRLAEQYLIRAEARAQQDKIPEAQADLNAIRNRAGLASISANDKFSLLLLIEKERRVELFSEWGHRWLDLKRTDRTDPILGPLKGMSWSTSDVLYPIPQSEIENNLNLLPQNPGY